ncbi:MAG: hypothetical protein E5Y32_17310, partial [Mesorhizobium sp.]
MLVVRPPVPRRYLRFSGLFQRDSAYSIDLGYGWENRAAPAAVAVSAGIGLSWFVGLDSLGVAIVGFIPQSLPSITLPTLSLVQQLLPGALGIALMSFTESIAAGRAFAAPAEPLIKADRELL